jgi:hypothetical protein
MFGGSIRTYHVTLCFLLTQHSGRWEGRLPRSYESWGGLGGRGDRLGPTKLQADRSYFRVSFPALSYHCYALALPPKGTGGSQDCCWPAASSRGSSALLDQWISSGIRLHPIIPCTQTSRLAITLRLRTRTPLQGG